MHREIDLSLCLKQDQSSLDSDIFLVFCARASQITFISIAKICQPLD